MREKEMENDDENGSSRKFITVRNINKRRIHEKRAELTG